MVRHIVAKRADVPEGGHLRVELEDRPIAVYNVNGEFFALMDRCPHEGASLCAGDRVGLVQSSKPGDYCYSRSGEMIKCPWHGWEFDIRTGQSWCDPSRVRVRSYPATVESGDLLVKGPYVAERFEVSIEDDYIVVEV